MRKISHGQSVMLCAPHEIHRKIVECSGQPAATVEDVLIWSMSNTHEYTRKCVPLWSIQGMRHQKREIVWHGANRAGAVLEPEAKTLAAWYGIRESEGTAQWLSRFGHDVLQGRSNEVESIKAKMAAFGTISVNSAALYEEQERELSKEPEHERQQERPPKMMPAKDLVHEDLVRMVKRGWLESSTLVFAPAFQSLANTRALANFNLESWPTELVTTRNFAKTLEIASSEKQDQFTRPVQWIMTCSKSKMVAIISPFEANELHLLVSSQNKITLHVYSPRVKDSMQPIDDLNYCSVPSVRAFGQLPELIRIELNLFAGQLYFKDREEYVAVCRFLGLAYRAPGADIEFSADGFVAVKDREKFDPEMARVCTMTKSPVDMLRALMELRRKGQGFGKTHMGLLLGGELLNERSFST